MSPYLLQQRLERLSEQAGDRPAVSATGVQLSYRQLEQASRYWAWRLRAAGCPAGARVGVWMAKSPAAVVGQLAALRAGAVYVPLDRRAPEARVAALGADCGLWGLFSDARGCAAGGRWAVPPAWFGALEATGLDRLEVSGCVLPPPPPVSTTSDDLAYILYTSGSTGVPKGVMLTHAHALNFVEWASEAVGLGPGDRVASHAPFHFDLSIFDLWASLSRGAEVCLLDAVTAQFPRAVAEWVLGCGITVWYSVPSALVQLLPYAEELGQSRLRAVIFAGEVFPLPALERWRRALPQVRFYNWYGPTETNVCCHYALPPAPQPLPDPLPIGGACPNFELMVADEYLEPPAAGTDGFLWARGPGVLAGYWGDRQRTAQVTRWRPAADGAPAERWYNTGDLVRRGADGLLYFQGRRDHLVKVRGYRISLLEIEKALESCSGVAQAVVLPPENGGGLEAHVVAVAGADLNGTTLRGVLAQRLPAYMVPECIVPHVELPLTSTGKIDRRLLLQQRQTLAACPTGPSQ
ncbi:MAG: amino acid adenylation domain-containing protein [Terriglobales bacterium]